MDLKDEGDHGFGCTYEGSPAVATNGSIVVAVTDDPHEYYGNSRTGNRTYPGEDDDMGIRDAFSLNHFRTMRSPTWACKVAICGRVGSDIIVTANKDEIAAHRGNDVQTYDLGRISGSGNGIPLLGCETHLIAFVNNTIKLFGVEHDSRLLSHRQTFRAMDQIPLYPELSWGPNNAHFILYHNQQISIW